MFIKDDALINIVIYYKKLNRGYSVYTEKEFKKLYGNNEEIKKQYKVLNVKMRELTWGLHNQLQEEAMIENSKGELQFNFKTYKENRLQKLIKEWDAKNEEKDKLIAVNRDSLSHLVPQIAESILRAYDEVSFVDEGEEKNL